VKELPDPALIARVLRRGDERAFGALYDRHTPYLYRLALRLAGYERSTAEDWVHDSWVAAMERLPRYEGRSELRTWLAGFVVNAARAAWRSEGRASELEATHAAEDRVLIHALDRLDLERAIAGLPDRARHVLILHDVEGWTHEAIAERLGIETGTSKSQLSRARALVRRQLRNSDGETG
jgi:RNA polymerase sigma factor (sigma-70 family)